MSPCKHNSYWRTLWGGCMACRAEHAEKLLADYKQGKAPALVCNWPAVWNTFVYWIHGLLTGHKPVVYMHDHRIWICPQCDDKKKADDKR